MWAKHRRKTLLKAAFHLGVPLSSWLEKMWQDATLCCPVTASKVKGVVYDSGESLLISELNKTNTPLSSVLLQTCASNSQR